MNNPEFEKYDLNKPTPEAVKIEMAYREGIIEGARRKESMERELYEGLKGLANEFPDSWQNERFINAKQLIKKYEDSFKAG